MREHRKHHELPTNREKREVLRNKGQFWTPDWVASAMVQYLLPTKSDIFDPAVGMGAFYTALRHTLHNDTHFIGIDNDIQIIDAWKESGLDTINCHIAKMDFVTESFPQLFNAIIANPPYIRHHRLSDTVKKTLAEISVKVTGKRIDARAGLHVYFLIKALGSLARNGRLAFIVPADTCEGVFAETLWNWIGSKFCIDAVITFSPNATPFPGVDVNAILLFIRNSKPKEQFKWVIVKEPHMDDLRLLVENNFNSIPSVSTIVHDRYLTEGLSTGLSRPPSDSSNYKYYLKDFAKVMRGIASGANHFFYLTESKASELQIPREFLRIAIGKTRDVDGVELTETAIDHLRSRNKPYLLLSLDGREISKFPAAIANYLQYGETSGLHNRALIRTRKPWYKMEVRTVPPVLFAYLGRRNARFIKNRINALPLTGFLCVYPHILDAEYIEKLVSVLNNAETIKNLALIGKSYGGGAVKVEPRGLEHLPIPTSLIEKYDLEPMHAELSLFP